MNSHHPHQASFPLQILRLPAVMARTGMKKSFLYREAAAGRFPPPVKIGAASGWCAAAVENWIAERLSGGHPAASAEG